MSYFSDTLIHLRKKAGLSQQQLAEATGLSRSAIGMYETGRREPDMDTLRLFSSFFGVDMNTLTSPQTAADAEPWTLEEAVRALSRRLYRQLDEQTKKSISDGL